MWSFQLPVEGVVSSMFWYFLANEPNTEFSFVSKLKECGFVKKTANKWKRLNELFEKRHVIVQKSPEIFSL
jgi:hypothetical protein